ncbi:MAG: ABC transporter permease [Gammaproteobacteria bacterium]|nr:ABC transporter permease [Gammaproteobacteria bacterium]
MFIARLQEMTEVRHFVVGMVKAPVFAFLIASIRLSRGLQGGGQRGSPSAGTRPRRWYSRSSW